MNAFWKKGYSTMMGTTPTTAMAMRMELEGILAAAAPVETEDMLLSARMLSMTDFRR